MLATPLLAAAVLAAAPPPPADAWSPAVQRQIAVVATRLMPPALTQQLVRHSQELAAGTAAPFAVADPESHALHADGRYGTAPRRVEEQVAKIVTMLGNRVPFSEVVYEMGVASHYVADAAWPLATSDGDARERDYAADLARYTERNLRKFPNVFYGFERFDRRPFTPDAYLRGVAERANRYYPLLGRAYFPRGDGVMVSSQSFDDRHPAFGIGQLSFNHAVSAVANVWLFVWREAHGDMTGLVYQVAWEGGVAQGPAGTPQRP